MEWSFDEIRGFIPKSISLPYSREEKNGYRSVLTGRDELNYIMLTEAGATSSLCAMVKTPSKQSLIGCATSFQTPIRTCSNLT